MTARFALTLLAAGLGFTNAFGQTIITFDALPTEPALNYFAYFSATNVSSLTYDGVTFDPNLVVVGDQYVESFQNNGGNATFATPVSAPYAVFNAFGNDALILTTTQTLLGAWFGQPNFGASYGGAVAVTVKALNGSTVLGSASMSLTPTMQFLDTSAFSGLSGITGYEIDRTASGTGPYGGGHWVADNLTFVAVPEPGTSAGLAGGASLAAALAVRRKLCGNQQA